MHSSKTEQVARRRRPLRSDRAGPRGSRLIGEVEALLRDSLGRQGDTAVSRARGLARRVRVEGLGISEWVQIQYLALGNVMAQTGADESTLALLRLAQDLFTGSVSPFEVRIRRRARRVGASLRRLNELVEAETKRIAHALHDEAGQLLVAAGIIIDRESRRAPAALREGLEDLKELVVTLDRRLRRLSHELRPAVLDDLGVVPALECLVSGLSRQTGLDISLDCLLKRRLPVETGVVLYRAVQEALSNVLRHAQAESVRIRIREHSGEVRCSVRDDGRGFNVRKRRNGSAHGLGLVGMRERVRAAGGTLSVHSTPAIGTQLNIRLPTGGDAR